MATKKKNKGVSALMKINRRAKQIVAYSGGSYRVAHKKASAEYRADHKPKARKKSVGKIHRKKIGKPRSPREVGKDRFDNKRVNITVGSVQDATSAQLRAALIRNAKQELAQTMMHSALTKSKKTKKLLNKKVAYFKKQIAQLG